ALAPSTRAAAATVATLPSSGLWRSKRAPLLESLCDPLINNEMLCMFSSNRLRVCHGATPKAPSTTPRTQSTPDARSPTIRSPDRRNEIQLLLDFQQGDPYNR